jgi:hypothetical protein
MVTVTGPSTSLIQELVPNVRTSLWKWDCYSIIKVFDMWEVAPNTRMRMSLWLLELSLDHHFDTRNRTERKNKNVTLVMGHLLDHQRLWHEKTYWKPEWERRFGNDNRYSTINVFDTRSRTKHKNENVTLVPRAVTRSPFWHEKSYRKQEWNVTLLTGAITWSLTSLRQEIVPNTRTRT